MYLCVCVCITFSLSTSMLMDYTDRILFCYCENKTKKNNKYGGPNYSVIGYGMLWV